MRAYTSARPDGAPTDPNPLAGVSFTLDDVEFRCEGEPDLLDRSELALLASQATDVRTPQAQAAIAAFLQMAFGFRVYAEFKMHTKEHHTPPEVIIEIIAGINEELEVFMGEATGRPTVRPSPSSPGEPERGERIQRIISLQRGDVTVVPLPEPEARPRAARPARRQSAKAKGSSSKAG